MCRVLLVDDEPIARMGLRSTFDWEANGFYLVGEASNGKNAMKWIERNEVDILITDIAMPVMDGLELMRTARDRCPWIKVVLLSCHNDFEYVREGIRLGASDYLLKPTLEPEDLKDVLGKIKTQVMEERKKNEMVTRMMRQDLWDRRAEMEKALIKLLAGEVISPDLTGDLSWLDKGYRVVICLLDGAPKFRTEEGGVFIEILIEEVQEWFYEFMEQGFAFRVCAYQLILAIPESPGNETYVMQQLTGFHSFIKGKGHSFTMGVSGLFTGVERLKTAYVEGREAARLRFYYGPGGIRSIRLGSQTRSGEDDSSQKRDKLKDTVIGGFKEKAAEHLESILRYWTYEHRTPAEVMREAQEVISLFQMCKKSSGMAIEQLESLRLMESVEEMRVLLWTTFEGLWKPVDESKEEHGTHRRIVGQAINYIKNNYTKDISLQDVADHVLISKNYFSEMFKRITGQNFIDYLIQLRLMRAKELLQTSNLKVYEVADICGFNDVKYFSKLFKKMLKISPAEFRQRGV